MKKNKFILGAIAGILFLSGCKKDDLEYDSNVKGPLSVEFDNVAGSSDLQLGTATYTNANAQQFNITLAKYYVSNFKFTRTDGTVYTVPQSESYFLVNEADATTHAPEMQVPEGEYKSVSFVLGVDSLRNTMDVSQRTGVLDVTGAASTMYWSWNSGYIFFKLEGNATGFGNYEYHVGGFGGYSTPTTNNLRTITLDLTARGTAKVKSGKETNIHLLVDLLKAVNGTTNMNFGTTLMIHSPTPGAAIANNYVNMFSHDHTEN